MLPFERLLLGLELASERELGLALVRRVEGLSPLELRLKGGPFPVASVETVHASEIKRA